MHAVKTESEKTRDYTLLVIDAILIEILVLGIFYGGNLTQQPNLTLTSTSTKPNVPSASSQYSGSSSLNSNAPIQTQTGENISLTLQIKSVHVDYDCIKSTTAHYVANWRSLIANLGANTIRMVTGTSGINIWGANMLDNPSDWDTNLMALFDYANPDRTGATGLKFWLQEPLTVGIEAMDLGTSRVPHFMCETYHSGAGWYTESLYGTTYYCKDLTGVGGIAETKTYLDALANSPNLHYNFLTDPRVIGWTWGNENYMGTGAGNPTYDWTVAMMDYTHTKGGKTIAECPIYGTSGWDVSLASVAPLFDPVSTGHADYINLHQYYIDSFMSAGRNTAAFTALIQSRLNTELSNKGNFNISKVGVSEFGLWHGLNAGYNSMFGLTAGTTFSEQDVSNYWTGYLQALSNVGIVNSNPFSALEGVDDFNFILAGATRAGYNEVANYYITDTSPTPTVDLPWTADFTALTPFTIHQGTWSVGP